MFAFSLASIADFPKLPKTAGYFGNVPKTAGYFGNVACDKRISTLAN